MAATASTAPATAVLTLSRDEMRARAPHLDRGASLADLYDPLTMPAGLLKAHQALGHAVDRAYRPAAFLNERERVEYLSQRDELLAAPLAPSPSRSARTKPRSGA